MTFHEWVKMNTSAYGDVPDDNSLQSEGAVIGIRGNPERAKNVVPSQHLNSRPLPEGIEQGIEQGFTDSSSEDPMSAQNANQGGDKRRRRRLLWAALACSVVLLAATIGVTMGLIGGDGGSDTSSSNQQQAGSNDGDFDFDDVDGTPSGSPVRNPIAEPAIEATDVPSTPPAAAQPTAPLVTVSPSVGTTATSTSMVPSYAPSAFPSDSPSLSPSSSVRPSGPPSDEPSEAPSASPTSGPTAPVAPVTIPPIAQLDPTSATLMTFCVIADVPYDEDEAAALPNQIANQMEGCEFLVHLGDIFTGDTDCNEEDYLVARDIMLQSAIPTFIVIGDNEWNDCSRDRIDAGWDLWTTHFLNFHDNWNNTFTVIRQPGYEENFALVHKRTLILSLNIVGGRVHNETEWATRLEAEFDWARQAINLNLIGMGTADGVIIMGHAKPDSEHRHFFTPFQEYVETELNNQFPILYLHGDGHSWMYTPSYENQENLLRIQHEGGVNEPVLKIFADPALLGPSVYNSFQYDRQIDKFGASPKPDNQSDRKKT